MPFSLEKAPRLRLLVDCIFFQRTNTGIARVWQSLLPLLSAHGIELLLLDRGNAPAVNGATYIPFPSHRGEDTAADSILIQQICDAYVIDVFTSTYYTSALSTPMLLMVYDMIPELFEFDLLERDWMEKQLSISFARRFVGISDNTVKDLRRLYPHIDKSLAEMHYPAVDHHVFREQTAEDVDRFRTSAGLLRRYYLFVGSREQHKGYKNASLFFDALEKFGRNDFDVLCVGGEEKIQPEVLAKLPDGVNIRRVHLNDADLSLAYAGADALIYPSLYEGFGLPVLEAMASGCPVITTRRGSLPEVAGPAAYYIGGEDTAEMADALEAVRSPERRQTLVSSGLKQAANFNWRTMAEGLSGAFFKLRDEAAEGGFDEFFRRWSALRRLQAEVDFSKPPHAG